ncbi:MAG: oxygenase MpaB family protein [Candidatus Promineifilaceae bacterium]|jgi:uncharacterized protein with NAD-binding domain and iron-sulfur cluster
MIRRNGSHTVHSSLWNDAFLDKKRLIGDPLADEVVRKIHERHDLARINEMMASLVKNDEIVRAEMPREVHDYLDNTDHWPDWADEKLIKQGEVFFDLHWPLAITLLFCASLPRAYGAHRGAQVLFLTQRMTKHFHRRIYETAQFLLDVMAPGGLGPDGRGLRSAQKVRLIHATTRRLIEHDPKWAARWRSEWGVPVNQEDLAGTLMTFSWQILDGLRRFNIQAVPEHEEAYLHSWKVVGHILGIDEDLLPADVADSYTLVNTISRRQMGKSEAGIELTKVLLGFLEQQIPGTLLDDFPATIIRHSIDPEIADMLEVPVSNWTDVLLNSEIALYRMLGKMHLGQDQSSKILDIFSYAVIQGLVDVERGGERGMFSIPSGLRSPLNLDKPEIEPTGTVKMANNRKTKIAILGGGVSAMTTAFEITSAPNWQDNYEVTVYQMGWRLGGKGASGRNAAIANRVEEHGFHFWWGFYDNAFNLMQRCHEELGRSMGEPLATWDEAFKPFDVSVAHYKFGGQWHSYPMVFPRNDLTPGQDLDRPYPTPAEYLCLLLEQLYQDVRNSKLGAMEIELPGSVKAVTRLPWWKKLIKEVEKDLGVVANNAGAVLLGIASRLACQSFGKRFGLSSSVRYEIVDALLAALIMGLWQSVRDDVEKETDFETYIAWCSADYAVAIVRGLIKDDIVEQGYDVINHLDFREWLRLHGASEVTLKSSTVRNVYDMVFAYEDARTPNIEAGTILRILLRSLFTYKGAYLWRMEAGMGDTIFGPIYQVLKNRGVEFKFFHRVDKLKLAPDGSHVQAIEIGRQVSIKDGKPYEPLTPVKQLPCWPNEPLYNQIVEGDALKERIEVAGQSVPKFNLESFWTPWEDAEKITLEYGKDFDLVILGASLGSIPYLCSDMLQAEGRKWDKWRNMVAHVKTVQTQAFQLWLKPDTAGMGWSLWRLGMMGSDGYDIGDDLVDSWADLSHLIIRESWPEDQNVNHIGYLVSVLTAAGELPDPSDHDFPWQQFERVKMNSLQFLNGYVRPLWPKAAGSPDHPDGLNWDLLVDLQEREGEGRFDGQFWRANIDPSEHYVISVAGSSQHRLKTDETGCHNFYITGDWIKNGANAGFVDSAVASGMQTAQVLTKRLLGQPTPKQIYGWPDAV